MYFAAPPMMFEFSVLFLCRVNMNPFVLVLCIAFIEASTNPTATSDRPLNLDERLNLLRWIRSDSAADPQSFLTEYRAATPNTVLTIARVSSFRQRVLLGAIVPMWLHNALKNLRADQLASEESIVDALLAIAPSDAPPMLRLRIPLAHVATLWQSFCINPSRSFPKKVFCGPVGQDMVLTKSQFNEFMNHLELVELNTAFSQQEDNGHIRRIYEEWRNEPFSVVEEDEKADLFHSH